ncbi:hypothetical protein C1S82_20600 [Mycolicibacterium cosmeticum]|uniref:Integral membrane protein n=1 Tax=Mycolicibacterium cosmeticum TaxID=258533 RepID=W9ATX4_MYCCO|nr:DUF308 domain-containing protein [Mycolicibacterium cosmeticum]TLH71360.1 hypothetical protein C1S82_20600 [Mycolicibacterium cosmeticum]CDO06357.1 integral membrane protein [Mycolicibacterium cosmeticum]
MTETLGEARQTTGDDGWLKRYYFVRAAFSIVWVGAAVSLADSAMAVVAALLLIYPAWDAVANVVDARRNGGLRSNPTQTFNTVVSSVTTIAVAVALTSSMNDVLRVFGLWASLSGLLQLATAVRRWKTHGAQWPMIISGIQSTAAGISFVIKASAPMAPQVDAIAPYAAFGAFYFLLSAIWLTVTQARRRRING